MAGKCNDFDPWAGATKAWANPNEKANRRTRTREHSRKQIKLGIAHKAMAEQRQTTLRATILRRPFKVEGHD